jgi:hypothetical protein
MKKNSEVLREALGFLREDGWCTHILWDANGQRCALGAVYRADAGKAGQEFNWTNVQIPALAILDAAIPHRVLAACERGRIAYYNNTRRFFREIEVWFERAIELAEAKEMYEELSQPVSTATVDPNVTITVERDSPGRVPKGEVFNLRTTAGVR